MGEYLELKQGSAFGTLVDMLLVNRLTSDHTVNPVYRVLPCVTGASDLDVTLPASPNDGEIHYVSKRDSGAGKLTVKGNRKNINGESTKELTAQYDAVTIIYSAVEGEWGIY